MRRLRLFAGLVLGTSLLFLAVWPVLAAQQEIASAGPLSRVIVSDTLHCQVAHRDDEGFEFYPSGSELGNCGTYLALGGTVYGPDFGPATATSWTPVSQSPVAGSGSVGDPLRVMTVVEIAAAGLRLQQTDSYVVGSESYRTDIQIANAGNAIQTGVLYRAGDCYLQGNDAGLVRVDRGAPACIVDPTLGRRIEQWLPITAGSHYFAGGYSEVWSLIGVQDNFPDRCECDAQFAFDNGAGLSWSLSVGPGQTAVFSHETFFSPLGNTAVEESFTGSVPDPTQISLDPVVIAQSVAITAGVIVLVPFPSALFNNTLEENYGEVMGWIARIRAWFARQSAALKARLRRWWEDRKARRAAAAAAASAAAATAQPGYMPPPPPPASVVAPAPMPITEAQPGDLYAPLTAKPGEDVWRTPLGMIGSSC